ncbi:MULTISPECIES: hypothetical protein [unclassified Novosphingobium]|uniref:hypothetical protein n=1 Tax=unclassified Novosphingobium TaxID=2644732 RepID=UPI00086CC49C|nr:MULTISPECIES: hypothetical protein [unclassified Novosphingobium]MBN9144662.1 hypothetical protein [Novosphingobium sp.]MDR6708294.1 cyanate permease [Novosphingobium sp. 1748]ODU77860.1 MAG: hypothetical protein ABT10_23895 [Novosphingobium sp. SCN 63-17]OJX92076.1 MAG: hypothetical protein BGP00_07265 [Novosphingobium sp. 63-713]
MPKSSGWLLLAAVILRAGIDLRPRPASIGPLLGLTQSEAGLDDMLTSLPVLLMGLCLPGSKRMQAALGLRTGEQSD